MPTYTYVCKECGTAQSDIRPMSQMEDCPPCPECEGETRISIGSLNWRRGSGWASRMDGAPMPGREHRD